MSGTLLHMGQISLERGKLAKGSLILTFRLNYTLNVAN